MIFRKIMRVQGDHRISIPIDVMRNLNIDVYQPLECTVKGNKIIYTPMTFEEAEKRGFKKYKKYKRRKNKN